MAILALFVLMILFLAFGVPIAGAIGLALLGNSLMGGDVSIAFIARSMVSALDSFPILAVPLFILAGEIMGQGGISNRLFNVANACLGRFTGGVPMATILTCMLFGAISGSGQATFAAVGSIMIPEMVRQGYNINFVTGLTASSGGLGVLIPPSLPMVMYGISASVSIGTMFTAGILPGILAGVALMIYAYIYCKRHPIPIRNTDIKVMPIHTSLKEGFWALLAPVIILGGIYGGIFTATEAAGVSVVYSLFVGMFVYRTIHWKSLGKIIIKAAALNAPILLIVSSATVLGKVLASQRVPTLLAEAILSTTNNAFVVLLMINLLLILVGMLMDTLSAIVILAPILLPIATGLGISPVHFGVIMVANLAIGFVTPPVGTNLYTAASLTGIKVKDLTKAIIGPVVALLIAQVFITCIAPISTWLPSFMK